MDAAAVVMLQGNQDALSFSAESFEKAAAMAPTGSGSDERMEERCAGRVARASFSEGCRLVFPKGWLEFSLGFPFGVSRAASSDSRMVSAMRCRLISTSITLTLTTSPALTTS